MDPVMAILNGKTNADLMVACKQLGYLADGWVVCDPTYGLGRFWGKWKPSGLVGSDLMIDRSPCGRSIDFTDMPYPDEAFDAVVFDPPYKLNGTGGSHPSDESYGVNDRLGIESRHCLIYAGISESTRVLKPKGYLLVKCQDQVSSGSVQWQTRLFSDRMESEGCSLIDMLHLPSYRPQPLGRRQLHARRNYSTLLVGQKRK